ncbi:hypothetical protein SCB49_08758 [unidentified eubacterium SCB49]|nr:hypothetical protein SCB49_08758 [unidentified eubacterium SCB49]
MTSLIPSIFSIKNQTDFQDVALQVFRYQYKYCAVYKKYCDLLKINIDTVDTIYKIPFLPITFFKEMAIISSDTVPETTFTSSGTTGSVTSKHHIADTTIYETSFKKGFEFYYGNVQDFTILALLPSYLEREGSSLVYMVDALIKDSKAADSGFYLNNLDALIEKLDALELAGKKTLLIGVSYALLDLIEKRKFALQHTIIMETGGMKGRRKELIKPALHALLKEGFGTSNIHSEYGMTELLSQAYSKEDGVFSCPPWMKILTRDTEDPFTLVNNKTGGINVIDLANIYSCSFIATQDLGVTKDNEHFTIMGRFDNSDIRGCNLMVLD